ncbi:hypothetical protein FQR65_LT06984 [Abscondita terminalis]|nr:hypothetical protein FQR65_LT06984 [Abscondita terminalis]
MDWKYILSLSPDNLDENEKDNLYSTIVWFDSDSEKLDNKKYNALLKISQELMKHKSEQVEALLAELDEIAVREGEEEARKQGSSDDLISLKSKKSQGDYEDLEQKYKDIKSKYKQQFKNIDALKTENDKLRQNLKLADEENLHLQEEIKSIINRGDESNSDISESVTDQYKELIRTIQHKNKQISQLLDDIQVFVEKECVTLQDQVSKLKDELLDASNHISSMTNDYSLLKIESIEKSELIAQLKDELETYRSQIQDYIEEKQQKDNQIDEFTSTIDKRIDEWKKILSEKDEEIKKLKSETKQLSVHSSKSSLSSNDDKSYAEMLTKVIHQREDQLVELRMQLQDATSEIEESTLMLKRLNAEKNSAEKRLHDLTSIVKNLKGQLKAAHARSQKLQDDVEYAEKILENKQDDINEILLRLKGDGKIELSEVLEEIQNLKSQLRVKDKQVLDYVKMTNKLQNSLDHAVNENSALRNKLGIGEDEDVSVATVLLKQYKQSKGHDKLHKQIHYLEEEKLNLKTEIQQLQRRISSLSLQGLNTNERDQLDSVGTQTSQEKSLLNNENDKYNQLLEENEGLRKGLHEILNSIQEKNERSKKEISSKTLEKLLCVLDARHVSGWYHPAMRLQAELNTLEGINKELREQLKNARLELSNSDVLKQDDLSLEIPSNMSSSTKDVITNTTKHLLNVLNSYHEQEDISSKLIQKLEGYKNAFNINDQQLRILYQEHAQEKQMWMDKEVEYLTKIETLDEEIEVLNSKLNEFNNMDEEESKKVERLAEISSTVVKLNRKCVFLENEESRLSSEVKKLKGFLLVAEQSVLEKIAVHKTEKHEMLTNISNLKKSLELSVSSVTLTNVQNRLEETIIKYRGALNEVQLIKSTYDKDVVLLQETITNLENKNVDLQRKLLEAIANCHAYEATAVTNETQNFAKKLAQAELNEITEKQRANHMTNLYGLVKDQLQKSEERFQEHEKVNQETLQKNLLLQQQMKVLEDQIMNYVAIELYSELKDKCALLEIEHKNLSVDNITLKTSLDILQKQLTFANEQSNENLEILRLKHQILDLQSTSDDKALIARLSSDVVYARLAETEAQNKLQDLNNELLQCQDDKLKQIVQFQREVYMGWVPVISEEVLVDIIKIAVADKQKSLVYLKSIQEKEQSCELLKSQLSEHLRLRDDVKENGQIQIWHEEKNIILVKELRLQKEIEFKTMQVEHLSDRLKIQDDIIIKLEEELLRTYHTYEHLSVDGKKELTVKIETREHVKTVEPKILKQEETQTCSELIASLSENTNLSAMLVDLETKLRISEDQIKEKVSAIEQLKNKITELEMNISLFRTQIGDKQSQITFYEKHILELQNKLKVQNETQITSSTVIEQSKHIEEITILNDAVKKLQNSNTEKDKEVLKYQTLLKKDRDEHSLAAARMQQDLKCLQDIINNQERAYKEMQESGGFHPGKAAIEQYINQVHALENHTADLHTTSPL